MTLILAIAALIIGVVALNKISTLNRRLAKLKEFSELLQAELKALRASRATQPLETSVDPMPLKTEPAQAARSEIQAQTASKPAPEDEAEKPKAKPQPQEPKPAQGTGGLEQALAGRWFVVLGGIAVALGGLLFIKYAHDNGLIAPWLRIVIGYVFAGALAYAGEYIRTHRPKGIADYVPAALSAAGLVIAFGVTYAAYALYDIFSASLCFPLLVAIGLSALWLSRRQGPLIAALGLIGSYAAPALVPSDNPNAWGFFAYLIVIVAASFYELRLRPWWWLGYAATAGATVWGLLWMHGGLFDDSHVIPASIFAYASVAAATFIPRGLSIIRDDVGSLADLRTATPPLLQAATATTASSLILSSIVWNASYSILALSLFAIGMALVVMFSWFKPQHNVASLMASGWTFATLMAWPNVSTPVPAFDERGFWVLVPQLVEPPRFVMWMLIAAAAFSAVGFLGVLRKATIRYWDIVAAGAAVLFVFGAWAKADFAFANSMWSMAGLAGAVVTAFAAWSLRSKANDPHAASALWVLLTATAVLGVFTADRLFDNIWFTLVIAIFAACYAALARLIESRTPASISVGLASFAALRLFVGREFWTEPQGLPLGQHWPVYGYGVPAALFWWASRQVVTPRDNKQKIALEGISLGLLVSLVSLELRVLIGGGITVDRMSVLELGSHVTAWLGAAAGLAWRQKLYSGFVSRWGTLALTSISLLALLGLLTVFNPAFTGDLLQGNAIFNGLWLGYLIPAALLALIINKTTDLAKPPQRTIIASIAMLLVMAFATLMVKRWYQGPRLAPEFISDPESYTVSLVWLMMGVGAFVAGIRFDRQSVRMAGLIILILTVLKVFILDLAGLTGLWRIASLMGLGFCLIGIGWLYTRFAARKSAAMPYEEPPVSSGKPVEQA
jgi:uncharacterized membrane protein